MMDARRTLRVYHSTPDTQLAREEAIHYLVTRELPERVASAKGGPEWVERYQNSNGEQQRSMRRSYGHITVAVGHVVQNAAVVDPPEVRRPAWDAWEPIFGLEVTISPFDPEANVVTGGGDIQTSIGGKPRNVDESQALLRALSVAVGIASSAQISVLVNNVITQ